MAQSPRFLPAGECAAVIELGDRIDPDLNARVLELDRALADKPFSGYREAIPSYRSLLVFFDPDEASLDSVRDHVRKLGARKRKRSVSASPVKEVPTRYDGPDLEEVARTIGCSVEEVVRLHREREYLVYMVGFTPGFAYMGATHSKLDLPRRSSPRTRVPAGSVAVAMGQTGIYPSSTPGGWHLLGRTDPRILFDLSRDPPSYFLPGDRVRFVPVDALPETPSRATPASTASGAAGFEVVEGGLLTTIQDLGRFGFQRYGVPVAGAVDVRAHRAANRLVGNPAGSATLECTVAGPKLRALRPLVVALTGADLGAVVEREDISRFSPSPWSSFFLRPGNVLRFEGRRSGARAYVAVAGGIDVPEVLGSRSTYLTAGFGGLEGRPLRAGDRVPVGAHEHAPSPGARSPLPPGDDKPLRVVLGPQADYFTATGLETLGSAEYTIAASSDRMGYRLEGPVLEHSGAKEIVSDGMMHGAIQVPPNGLPIVMLADRATMGGYPKVATVVTEDLPLLAQRLPGEKVRFEIVSLAEARRHR